MNSTIKAKSNGETLEEHTSKCLSVFSNLKEIYSELDQFTNYPYFYTDIFNALFFHDFGKAANGFQEALGSKKSRWKYRHEILSVNFVDCLNNHDLDFTKTMVLTHHKSNDELWEYYEDEYSIGNNFEYKMEEIRNNLSSLNQLIAKYPQF